MRRDFIHNPLFRFLAPMVYGVLLYLLVLLINNNIAQLNEIFSSQEVYICIGLTYLSFESIRTSIILIAKFLPKKYHFIEAPIQLVISTSLSTLLVIGCLKLYFIYIVGFSMALSQLLLFTFIYALSALLYNLIHFSNQYLHRENTLKLTTEKQQREVLEMEITEFKNDINPDLLYESLENVISLMNKQQDAAEEYIDYLASAYRYVLTHRQRELITINQEAEAAKTIVKLLNERYTGLITLNCSPTEKESKLCLIPGSLPIVIEYIIRNTIISYKELFIINCFIEDDYLIIQSKLNERLMTHKESSLAFERLQKSYSVYSERPLIQVKAYEENYIKLPLLHVAEDALTDFT